MNRKQTFSKIYEFFNKILKNNTFLKFFSVFLAIIAWMYILYVVDPKNEAHFDRVPVNLSFEGSVPDRNGYMYLMTDTNLTVNVTVSGPRSKLLNLSADALSVSLDMNSVVSPGTYGINVIVNVSEDEITVTDVYPKTFTIEFTRKITRTFPINVVSTGTLPEGYTLQGQKVSPATVQVTGPSETVLSIQQVNLTVSLTNRKENLTEMLPLTFLNEAGENVDRRYLTISDTEAEASLDIVYQKQLSLLPTLTNQFGGDERAYISTELSQQTVTATGPEHILSALESIRLPEIDTSQIYTSQDLTLTIPSIEGITFDTNEVTVRITVRDDTEVTTLRYSQAEIRKFIFLNAPSGTTPIATSESLLVQIRTTKENAALVTKENVNCLIDLSAPNADGSYPLIVSSSAIPSFGVLGEYSLKVVMG